MSVINDMLRDLEERRAPERDGLAGRTSGSVIAPPKARIGLLHYGIALSVVGLVAAGGYWQLNQTDDLVESSVTQAQTESIENPSEARTVAKTIVASEPPPAPLEASTIKPILTETETVTADKTVDRVAKTQTTEQSAPQPKAKQDKVVNASQKPESPTKPEQVAFVPAKKKARPVQAPVAEADEEVRLSSSPLEKEVAKNDVSPTTLELRLTPIARDQQMAEQGREWFAEGQVEQARRQLYDFIEAHEQDDHSRWVLAGHLIQENRMAESGDLLVVVTESSIPQLKELKARWLVAMNRPQEALALLEGQPPEVASHHSYYALLAAFYQQQLMFEQAIETYSALLETNSEVADWWAGMAIGLDQLQRYEDAALAYRQALALPNLQQSLAQFSAQRLEQLQGRQTSDA